MIGTNLNENEVAELRGMTDRELVALHNLGIMTQNCLKVGDTERADEINEVAADEMKNRGLIK
jgi:hypothetical protein